MQRSSFVYGQLALVILCSTAVAELPLDAEVPPEQQLALAGRIAESEAQLVDYEADLGTCCGQTQSSTSCCCANTRCCSNDLWTHPCGGAFGDAELLLLQWTDTDGDDSQSTAQASERYTIGYMDCQGRSFRVRYFDFYAPDQDGVGDFVTSRLDVEYAGRFTLGHNWRGDLSLGARWASLRNPTPRRFTNTWGPVVGIDLHSDICNWLSIYGTACQSFQFGTEREEDHEHVFGISELGAGLELSRSFRTSELFFRSGVEVQHYSSVRDDEEDYGLVGLALRFGLRR